VGAALLSHDLQMSVATGELPVKAAAYILSQRSLYIFNGFGTVNTTTEGNGHVHH